MPTQTAHARHSKAPRREAEPGYQHQTPHDLRGAGRGGQAHPVGQSGNWTPRRDAPPCLSATPRPCV